MSHTHPYWLGWRSPPARASPRLLRPAGARLPPRQELLPRAQAPARPPGVLQHVRVPLDELLAVAHADERAAAALQQAVQRCLGRRVQRAGGLRLQGRSQTPSDGVQSRPCMRSGARLGVCGRSRRRKSSKRAPPQEPAAAAPPAARRSTRAHGHAGRRLCQADFGCKKSALRGAAGARAPRPGRQARGGAGGGAGTRCAAARPGSARAPTPARRPARPRAWPALRAAPRRRRRGPAGQVAHRHLFIRCDSSANPTGMAALPAYRHMCRKRRTAYTALSNTMHNLPGRRTSSRRASSSLSLQPRSSALPSAAASAPQQPGSRPGGSCCAAMQRQLAAAAELCTNPGKAAPCFWSVACSPATSMSQACPAAQGPST